MRWKYFTLGATINDFTGIQNSFRLPGSRDCTATAIPAPDNAVAPVERQLQVEDPSITVRKVHEFAADYGIHFD
jgi:hypothetical protein